MRLRPLIILGVWLALAIFGTAPKVSAQGTLYPILSNGPTAKRLNVAILAEGYTTNQVAQFLSDATSAVNNLLAQSPYQEYRSYFNAFAIFVASAEAGSDHPESGTFKNTYFNSTYNSGPGIPQLLAIPPNNGYDGTYANGQGKVDALLLTLLPEYDLIVMVVNDPQYGGSGGVTLITSVDAFASEIIVHESGHTLGGLADEYSNPYPITPVERPNATAVTASNSIKWRVWIPEGTPIPTPQDPEHSEVIGLFQGAQYQATGWYRPKLDCKMRTIRLGDPIPFCEVCSEQLVKSIYGLVRPVEGFSPAATSVSLFSTQAVAFSVALQQPLTHSLMVQWYTNNVAVGAATNASFALSPKALGNGSHTVRAITRDPTALVRNDPTRLLWQTNTWNVTVSLNELALVSARYLATNRFRLTVTGTAPAGFVIQGSTNLAQWTSLSTNVLTGGKYDFTNGNLTNFPARYYRTVSPP